jgi:hypothetical protein
MVALTRDKNGGWHARKRIPDAVRDEFHHLYGQRHEAKFFAEGTTPDREARQLFNEWLAETEGRIGAIIAAQKGEGISLTHKQSRALAGEWYKWFVERHPPADKEQWSELNSRVHEVLTSFIGTEEEAKNPDVLFRRFPKVREALRPILSDMGETAQFLAVKSLVLNKQATSWTTSTKTLQPRETCSSDTLGTTIAPTSTLSASLNSRGQTPLRHLGSYSSAG